MVAVTTASCPLVLKIYSRRTCAKRRRVVPISVTSAINIEEVIILIVMFDRTIILVLIYFIIIYLFLHHFI